MISFIKSHWLGYIIAVVVAILLGAGAAFFVGVKGSTPASVRSERVAEEQNNSKEKSEIADFIDGSN